MSVTIHSFDFTGNAKPEHKTDFDGDPMAFLWDKVFGIPPKPKDVIDAIIYAETCGGLHMQFFNVHSIGIYKRMGWAYDFRPLMKKYVYCVDGRWTSGYAPNKTRLRKLIKGIEGKILEYK